MRRVPLKIQNRLNLENQNLSIVCFPVVHMILIKADSQQKIQKNFLCVRESISLLVVSDSSLPQT